MTRILFLLLCAAYAVTAQAQQFVLQPIWSAGGVGSGLGEFGTPESVAIDSLGQVVVTDKGRMQLHVYSRFDGSPLRDVGGRGTGLGSFDRPNGIVVDAGGSILVVEQLNRRIQVLDRNYVPRRAFGRSGGGSGAFQKPMGIALDSQGRIFVTDEARGDTQVFDAAGSYLWSLDAQPRLDKVESIEVHEPSGRIFVCDEGRSCVNVYDLQGRYQHSFGSQGSGPGQFGNDTNAVRLDGRGRIYVNDQGGSRINVFRSDTSFLASFRGTGTAMSSADGMAVSDAHNLCLVADQGNNRVLAWDLGEIQCRLARFELGAPSPVLGPLGASVAGSAHDAGSPPLWPDAGIEFETTTNHGDPSRIERSVLHVRTQRDPRGICVPLVETGPATNRFIAEITLSESSHESSGRLAASDTDVLSAHIAGEAAELSFEVAPLSAATLSGVQFDGREPAARLRSDSPLVTWDFQSSDARASQTGFEMRVLLANGSIYWSSGRREGSTPAWRYDGRPLPAREPLDFEMRLAVGRVWSAWTKVSIWRNVAPPGAIAAFPLSGSVLQEWPVPLTAQLAAATDGDPLRAWFEVALPEGAASRSPVLGTVDELLSWLPRDVDFPENASLNWRLVTNDGLEKRSGPWWTLHRNSIEEAPGAAPLVSPLESAWLHGSGIPLVWQAATDPDPSSTLRYDVEWSWDADFADFETLPAGQATTLDWVPPAADGDVWWRIRTTDATQRTSRSAWRHLRLERSWGVALQTGGASDQGQVLLGARAGAANGFGPEDHAAAPGAHLASLAAGMPSLDLDMRAPCAGLEHGYAYNLRLLAPPNTNAWLEVLALDLPFFWRADLLAADGTRLGGIHQPGDRIVCPVGAAGEAMLRLQITPKPIRGGRPEIAAATQRELDGSASTNPTPPLVVQKGSRLQLAAATERDVRFEIYDVRGRRVRHGRAGVDGTWLWDGRDAHGVGLATGVYFLQVRAHGTAPRRHRLLAP